METYLASQLATYTLLIDSRFKICYHFCDDAIKNLEASVPNEPEFLFSIIDPTRQAVDFDKKLVTIGFSHPPPIFHIRVPLCAESECEAISRPFTF